MSMTKRIDITDDLDYRDLNTAIERLTALRKKHGGKSTMDINLKTAPYEDTPHIEVTLIIKK